jgi:hypothetical protein
VFCITPFPQVNLEAVEHLSLLVSVVFICTSWQPEWRKLLQRSGQIIYISNHDLCRIWSCVWMSFASTSLSLNNQYVNATGKQSWHVIIRVQLIWNETLYCSIILYYLFQSPQFMCIVNYTILYITTCFGHHQVIYVSTVTFVFVLFSPYPGQCLHLVVLCANVSYVKLC